MFCTAPQVETMLPVPQHPDENTKWMGQVSAVLATDAESLQQFVVPDNQLVQGAPLHLAQIANAKESSPSAHPMD